MNFSFSTGTTMGFTQQNNRPINQQTMNFNTPMQNNSMAQNQFQPMNNMFQSQQHPSPMGGIGTGMTPTMQPSNNMNMNMNFSSMQQQQQQPRTMNSGMLQPMNSGILQPMSNGSQPQHKPHNIANSDLNDLLL